MNKMKAAQVSKAGGGWELVERSIPEPGAGQVLIKVEACGICHSDMLVKEGHVPGIQYPRVPGHEVAGSVDAVGRQKSSSKQSFEPFHERHSAFSLNHFGGESIL